MDMDTIPSSQHRLDAFNFRAGTTLPLLSSHRDFCLIADLDSLGSRINQSELRAKLPAGKELLAGKESE